MSDQRGEQEDALLDALAVVEASTNRSLQLAGPVLRAAGEGLTVAVLGALTVDEAAELVRYRHGAGPLLAVALDVDTWRAGHRERAATADQSGPVAVLRGAGWRVVTLAAGQRARRRVAVRRLVAGHLHRRHRFGLGVRPDRDDGGGTVSARPG